MTPKEYKQMMDYLTRSGIRDRVKFASDIAIPDPKPVVKEIELFNEFNRRNPRADGGRIGFADGPKSSKVKTKEFPVERQFYNRRTGKLETLYFKGQESTKVATPLPKNKIPKFKKLYKDQNPFKTMAKKLGVSYDVLKDLEEDLINKGDLQKRKLSRVPTFRNPYTGDLTQRPASIERAKKVTKMADFIEKEIEKFNKTKILPNEQYEVDYNKLKKKFNITKAETLTGFLDSVDAEKDLDYIRPASSEKGTNRRTGLTDEQVNKYKKEYKSKPLNTLAQEMSGKGLKNKNTSRIRGALERLRNTLIDRKLINVEDIATRASVPFDPTFKLGSGDKAQYLQKQVNLAKLDPKGIINDPKYFSQRGPFTGKFNPQTFDRELLKFLNMDTVEGSLDPKLFEKGQAKFLKPSFEHIQGITPGDIIGDSQALRNVTIATRRYNFQEMGASSNLYKDVKDYLRVAMAALKNNDKTLANDSVRIVNEVYDKVSERFPNLNRKDLPNYSIKGNNVKETNLKGLIKPQKLEDSFKQYFKSAADTIKPSELKIAERVQPNFAKVINLFKDGKIKEGYNLIKSRIPSVKGGAKFAIPILAGGTAINFLTSPAEAADGAQTSGFTTEEKLAGAGTAAAAYKFRKPIVKGAKAVGRTALKTLGPLAAPLELAFIGSDLKSGSTVPEAIADVALMGGIFRERDKRKFIENKYGTETLNRYVAAKTPGITDVMDVPTALPALSKELQAIDAEADAYLQTLRGQRAEEFKIKSALPKPQIDAFQAAGGGIAKLAGVSSGPPPERGPNSQGLPGLLKRVKKQ